MKTSTNLRYDWARAGGFRRTAISLPGCSDQADQPFFGRCDCGRPIPPDALKCPACAPRVRAAEVRGADNRLASFCVAIYVRARTVLRPLRRRYVRRRLFATGLFALRMLAFAAAVRLGLVAASRSRPTR